MVDLKLPPLPQPKVRRHQVSCAVFDPSPGSCDCGSLPKVYDADDLRAAAERVLSLYNIQQAPKGYALVPLDALDALRTAGVRVPCDCQSPDWCKVHARCARGVSASDDDYCEHCFRTDASPAPDDDYCEHCLRGNAGVPASSKSEGCDLCRSPLFAGTKCKNCGRVPAGVPASDHQPFIKKDNDVS